MSIYTSTSATYKQPAEMGKCERRCREIHRLRLSSSSFLVPPLALHPSPGITQDAMSSPTNPGSPSSKLPPFTRPKNPSPNVETVLKYIDALAALDPHSVIAQFDDRCMHHILPRSLGRPVLTKDQYLFYLVAIFKMFNSYQVRGA